MPLNVKLALDAADAIAAVGQLTSQIDAMDEGVQNLNQATTSFNKSGTQLTSVIKQQIDQFTTLTSVVNRHGVVVRQTYTYNEAAARKAQDAEDKRAAKAFANAEKERERAEKQLSTFEAGLQRLGRNIVQFGTYRAFNVITDSIYDGVQAAKDFQVQISLIRTLSQDSQQSFSAFGKQIRAVSDKSGFNVKDVGKAFYNVASDQVAKGGDIAPFVQTATDLARVTGSELPNAINTLDSILNSYSLSASDAEKVSAILFKTIDVGRININELSNTFGRVGPLAESLGVDLTEVAATMAITTQKGTKTADAMTLLTNLLTKIEKPTAGAKDFFKATFGTESGEAALAAAGGLLPLITKIVEATRTGKAQVSDFFDEIRGRKQFAVFEQSLPEIQRFAAELQNTSKITKDYRAAVKIRDESPADQLAKEANKFKNIFTVDLGQNVIEAGAKLLQYTGGVDTLKSTLDKTGEVLKFVAIGLTAYGVRAAAVAVINAGLAGSFKAAGNAALFLIRNVAPLAAVTAGYLAYNEAVKRIENVKSFGSNIDPSQYEETLQKVQKLRAEAAKETPYEDKFKGLEDLKKSSGAAYGEIIKYIGAAQKANNQFLEDVRERTKDATEQAKVSFGALGDAIREKMSDARKNISKATEEIQSSAKKVLGFSETIDNLIYSTREKYANDNFGEQKINNTQNRLDALKLKADELATKALGAPDAEKAAEYKAAYDKVYGEIAQLATKKFDLVTEHQKTQYEQYLKQNPLEAQRPGANLFLVDTSPVERQLKGIEKAYDEFSAKYEEFQKKQVVTSKKLIASDEERLRKLTQAFKDYEKVDVFNQKGEIREEFKTDGKFDSGKVTEALKKYEDQIKEGAKGTSPDVQFKLLQDLANRRFQIIKEAGAAQRAEDLKSAESKVLADKDANDRSIDDIKKKREELLKDQDRYIAAGSQKQHELRGFASLVGKSGDLDDKDKKFIEDAIDKYNKAFEALRDQRKDVGGGVSILDSANIQRANEAYKDVLSTIQAIRDRRTTNKGDFSTPSAAAKTLKERDIDWSTPGAAFKSAFYPDEAPAKGTKLELAGKDDAFTIGEAKAASDAITQDALRRNGELLKNAKQEQALKKTFDSGLSKQVDALKKQFPELEKQVTSSTKSIDTDFRNLANGGLQQLIEKLKDANDLIPKVKNGVPQGDAGGKANGKVGIADYDSTGVVYAAEGGVVGQFPGQPRGVDRYPIWAAEGETIISARTSAMYRPMIAAIMTHRMPQYMADGGVVGGDTNIGDINITVNGATTNNETARIIGNRLERQLKRGNIKLGKA